MSDDRETVASECVAPCRCMYLPCDWLYVVCHETGQDPHTVIVLVRS